MLKRSSLLFVLLVALAAVPAVSAEITAAPDNGAQPDVTGDIQVDVGGVKVSIDRETGRMRTLPTEAARELQRVILKSFNVSASLQPKTSQSGEPVIELDDRHMNWYMATVAPDGDVQFSCVSSLGDVTATMLRSMTETPASQQPPATKPAARSNTGKADRR